MSDPATEEAFFDTPLYRAFVDLLDSVRLPDESTILRFRQRLAKHDLAVKILAEVDAVPGERDLMPKECTQAHRLLYGHEESVWEDAGYQGVEKRPGADNVVT